MLMADDRSDHLGFDGFSLGDDDPDLSMDLTMFWEIMAEDNIKPDQSSPEDLSEGKQQNLNLSSDAGNGENANSQEMGLMQPERTLSWEQLMGSGGISSSFNSEASDLRLGLSQGSFDSGVNSATPDYRKQDALPTQFGSPMHSCSGSLVDWISPAPCYDSFGAGSNHVFQNTNSFSRDDSNRTQFEQPNCSDPFSFPAKAINAPSDFTANLGSGNLQAETDFQFMCAEGSEGHSTFQYGPHNTFLGNSDVNYDQYCGSAENSFKTQTAPAIMDSSMIDMNIPFPWDLDDDSSIQLMSKKNEVAASFQDVMVDLPTPIAPINGVTMPDVQVGEVGQSGLPWSGAPNFSGRKIKNENDNLLLPRAGKYFSKAGTACTTDRRSMLYKRTNVKQVNQVKDENSVEQVSSQGKPYVSFVGSDVANNISTPGIYNGFTADKRARQLLPRILPSSSSEKHVIHIKDEKDMFQESKRARHTLSDAEDKKINLAVDGRCFDVQASEQPCRQAPSSMRSQLDCKNNEGESKLIQRSSIDTQFSKASCRTVHTTAIVNSFDDDADVCIIENLSDPSRASRSINTKHVAPQSAASDTINPTGMGGTKFRANDERLIFRAVVQDLSQPRTEANPPDGLLAVPLLRHQRIALSWMVQKETAALHCSGGILADDQGLGKTISTIALILKERAPTSKTSPDNVKPCITETLNLDDDDDCVSEVVQLKQNDASCSSALSDGASIRSKDNPVEAKGRLAAGTLVVCPTSVLRQWADELHNKVTKEANLSVLVYHGGNRTKDHFELAKYDVVLTTYAIVSMEVPKQPLVDRDEEDRGRKESRIITPLGLSSGKKRKYPPGSEKRSKKDKKGIEKELLESTARPLARVGWFRVILDEAQSIKNHRTQVARACWGLRAKRRWCLSGTPIQNAVDDLYSYFRFLRYDPYAVFKSFISTIKVPISRNPTNGYKKLQAVLKTIMLRRTKGEVPSSFFYVKLTFVFILTSTGSSVELPPSGPNFLAFKCVPCITSSFLFAAQNILHA